MPEINQTVTLRVELTLTEFLTAAGVPDVLSYKNLNGQTAIAVEVVRLYDYSDVIVVGSLPVV